MSAGRELAAARPETRSGKPHRWATAIRSRRHGTSETLRLPDLAALGGPCGIQRFLDWRGGGGQRVPGHVCLVSGAMRSATSSGVVLPREARGLVPSRSPLSFPCSCGIPRGNAATRARRLPALPALPRLRAGPPRGPRPRRPAARGTRRHGQPGDPPANRGHPPGAPILKPDKITVKAVRDRRATADRQRAWRTYTRGRP